MISVIKKATEKKSEPEMEIIEAKIGMSWNLKSLKILTAKIKAGVKVIIAINNYMHVNMISNSFDKT